MQRLEREIKKNNFKWGQTDRRADRNSKVITKRKKEKKRSIQTETVMKPIHLPIPL